MSITMKQLLDAGAHFGHQTHRWNPKMKPYIYGARNGIYIINLEKTLDQWNKARKAIVSTVTHGKKVLFVGTKLQAQKSFKKKLNAPNNSTLTVAGWVECLQILKRSKNAFNVWKNWKEFLQLKKSKNYSKKDQLKMNKERLNLGKNLNGIKSMSETPGLIVVVDPNKEHIAIQEAATLGHSSCFHHGYQLQPGQHRARSSCE
jgi:small subunit ribosomal protein S2